MGDNNVNLPPGFRFSPTDKELVIHFLCRKASLLPCHPDIIPDLDLHLYDPWELNGKALASDNQWYFFSRRIPNRITANGYWKPMCVDEPIVTNDGKKVGMKKYLAFYIRKASMGFKTNWIMHEFSLLDFGSSKKRGTPKMDRSKWVLCQVFERSDDSQGSLWDEDEEETDLSCLDEVSLPQEDLDETISFPN